MKRLLKNTGLVLLLISITLIIYEVSWCLIDPLVRIKTLAWKMDFLDYCFDFSICSAFTLVSLCYSILILKFLKRAVKRLPLRWALLSLLILAANIIMAVASTSILDLWLDYVSNAQIRAENFYVFGLVVTFTTTSYIYFQVSREGVEAERKIKEVELYTLRSQINPHFMANTIGLLGNLTQENPKQAADGLSQLAQMYRYILNTSDQKLAPIGDELDFLQDYVSLIHLRFSDRMLKVEWDDELDCANGWILPMSLQLLVENAIKHNRKSENHPVVVRIHKDADEIVVENNRQPLGSPVKSTKKGLENLRRRLSVVTDRPLVVTSTDEVFAVRIPIIKPQLKDERIDYRR